MYKGEENFGTDPRGLFAAFVGRIFDAMLCPPDIEWRGTSPPTNNCEVNKSLYLTGAKCDMGEL